MRSLSHPPLRTACPLSRRMPSCQDPVVLTGSSGTRGGGGPARHSRDTPAQGCSLLQLDHEGWGRPVGREGEEGGWGSGGACGKRLSPLVSALWLAGLPVSRLWVAMEKSWLGPWVLGWLEDAGLGGSMASSMAAAPPCAACTGRSGGCEMLGVPWLQVRLPVTPTLTCSPPSSLVSLPPSVPKASSASPSPPTPSACRTVAAALGPYLQNVRALASQLATVSPGPLDLGHCSLKGCRVSPARSWIDFQRQSLPFPGAICVLSAPGEQEGFREDHRDH